MGRLPFRHPKTDILIGTFHPLIHAAPCPIKTTGIIGEAQLLSGKLVKLSFYQHVGLVLTLISIIILQFPSLRCNKPCEKVKVGEPSG